MLAVNAPTQNDNIPDWAQAVVCSERHVANVLQTAAAEKPVLVCRSRREDVALGLRVECDRLQRDLASLGQFAGYMVTPA